MHLTCRRAEPSTGDLFLAAVASPASRCAFPLRELHLANRPELFHDLYIVIDSGRSLVVEHHIDPVVGALKGAGRKCTAAAIIVNTTVLQRLQRRIIYCRIEIVPVNSKISRRTKVRCNIYGVGREGHRRREVHLLPARAALPCEGRPRQQRAAAAPEVPYMGACVIDTLEETHSGNEAAGIGCEPYPQFDRQTLIHVRCPRRRRARPDRARTLS